MRSPQLYAIGNEKGGVLKSTITLHLGDCSHNEFNQKILIVDLDTQDTIRKFYQDRKHKDDHAVIGESISLFEDSWQPQALTDKINILAGGYQLADKAKEISIGRAINFMKRLRQYDADIILIDLPPTVSAIQTAAIANADGVIIPTDFSKMANHGLDLFVDKIQKLVKHPQIKAKVKPLAVVATLIDNLSLIHI